MFRVTLSVPAELLYEVSQRGPLLPQPGLGQRRTTDLQHTRPQAVAVRSRDSMWDAHPVDISICDDIPHALWRGKGETRRQMGNVAFLDFLPRSGPTCSAMQSCVSRQRRCSPLPWLESTGAVERADCIWMGSVACTLPPASQQQGTSRSTSTVLPTPSWTSRGVGDVVLREAGKKDERG